jgi:hypothetical protein
LRIEVGAYLPERPGAAPDVPPRGFPVVALLGFPAVLAFPAVPALAALPAVPVVPAVPGLRPPNAPMLLWRGLPVLAPSVAFAPLPRFTVMPLRGVVPTPLEVVAVECRTIEVVDEATTPAAVGRVGRGTPPNGLPGAFGPWWVFAAAVPAPANAIHSAAPETAAPVAAVRSVERRS